MSTELAVQSPVVGRGDLGFKSAVDKGIRTIADNLIAHPYAFAAQNATIHIAFDQGIDLVLGQIELLSLEAIGVHFVLICQILQVAFTAFIAYRAIKYMIDQQEFKDSPANLADFIGHGGYHHAFGYRRGTGGDEASLHLLDLNQANSAGAIRKKLFGVAKYRNLDAGLFGGLIDRSLLANRNLFAVNRKIYHLNLVSIKSVRESA